MFLEVCLFFLVSLWMWHRHRTSARREMLGKFPGPKAYPIVGNITQLRGTTEEILNKVLSWCNNEYYGTPWRIHIGPQTVIIITDPKDFEIILGSNTQISKGNQYKLLLPWFGTGLLTSTGEKWRSHRKIITPTFHFKILEGFVDVFNANGDILVEQLAKEVNGSGFDAHKYIHLLTLDIICETAMGVTIKAQTDSDSEYVQAIRDMTEIIMMRGLKLWLAPDFLFWFSRYKPVYDKSLAIIHKKTNDVIKTRKNEINNGVHQQTSTSEGESYVGERKRLAFLDMLIESVNNGSNLTDEEIREEVDTFMFEGHDTTASAISFALWVLAWHQDVQEKVYKELQEVFPDPDEPLTFRGLQELKYLERMIKETLRCYPSVPFFSRQLTEDVKLSGGLVIPTGTTVCNLVYTSLKDPKIWSDPLKFDPDRFTPENCEGRHPYAFVPFSAGPRNCIGQKFAMLEMKSSLSHILRAYKLMPDTTEPELRLSTVMVLKSLNGVNVKIVPRK